MDIEKIDYRRLDYDCDIPAVMDLIHKNLDSTLSQEFFLWKHLENPFGKSYGILATSGSQIIGLRMFMFWEFLDKEKGKIRGIRPVDTVTDEKFRGNGIFKKLTMMGLAENRGNYDIVFNTPNQNSLPGYIKMGWRKIESPLFFSVGFLNPLSKSLEFSHITSDEVFIPTTDIKSFRTRHYTEFIRWRYKEPVYRIADFKNGNYVIYKTSVQNKFKTVLVFDVIGKKNNFGKMVSSVAKKLGIYLIYFISGDQFEKKNFLLSFKRSRPVIVARDDSPRFGEKINFSLGDLEGRI